MSEERWRTVYTEEQLKKIQDLGVKNLKYLDGLCKAIGVEYFLYGGTLLGAVKYSGFIPWDDDVDVAMMRDDYVKFIREAPKHISDEYFLQSPYTDKKSPFLYTKLRLRGSVYSEFIHHRLNIEQGVYIDIYPIDNLPDSDDEYLRLYKRYLRLTKLYVLRQCKYPSVEGKGLKRRAKNLARRVLSTVTKLIPQRLFVAGCDKILTKYNRHFTRRKGNYFYPRPVNVFSEVLPLVDGKFEGMDIKMPKDWKEHLKSRYGDYSQLPPAEQRIGHEPYRLDFGNY